VLEDGVSRGAVGFVANATGMIAAEDESASSNVIASTMNLLFIKCIFSK
jgi:hypothetical protein